jgi:hypothetical protein
MNWLVAVAVDVVYGSINMGHVPGSMLKRTPRAVIKISNESPDHLSKRQNAKTPFSTAARADVWPSEKWDSDASDKPRSILA